MYIWKVCVYSKRKDISSRAEKEEEEVYAEIGLFNKLRYIDTLIGQIKETLFREWVFLYDKSIA